MSAHEKRAWVRFFLLPRSHLHTSRYLLISTTFCLCRAWSQTCVSVLMFVCGLEYNPESPARAAQKWSINSVLKEEDEWRETHAARDTNFLRETNWRVPVQTDALNRSTRLPLTDNRTAQARLTDSLWTLTTIFAWARGGRWPTARWLRQSEEPAADWLLSERRTNRGTVRLFRGQINPGPKVAKMSHLLKRGGKKLYKQIMVICIVLIKIKCHSRNYKNNRPIDRWNIRTTDRTTERDR